MTFAGMLFLYLTAVALVATFAWAAPKVRLVALVLLGLMVGAPLVLATLLYITVVPEVRRALVGPDHRAEARVGRLGVGVELWRGFPHAEYKRRLVTRVRGGVRSVTELNDDWGPAARTNLYLRSDGVYVLISHSECHVIDPRSGVARECRGEGEITRHDTAAAPPSGACYGPWPERPETRRLGRLRQSLYFDDLYYVGVFHFVEEDGDRRQRRWRYSPAANRFDLLPDLGACDEWLKAD